MLGARLNWHLIASSRDVPHSAPHARIEMETLGAAAAASRESCGPASFLIAMRRLRDRLKRDHQREVIFYVATDKPTTLAALRGAFPPGAVMSYGGEICRDYLGDAARDDSDEGVRGGRDVAFAGENGGSGGSEPRGRDCMVRALVEQRMLLHERAVGRILSAFSTFSEFVSRGAPLLPPDLSSKWPSPLPSSPSFQRRAEEIVGCGLEKAEVRTIQHERGDAAVLEVLQQKLQNSRLLPPPEPYDGGHVENYAPTVAPSGNLSSCDPLRRRTTIVPASEVKDIAVHISHPGDGAVLAVLPTSHIFPQLAVAVYGSGPSSDRIRFDPAPWRLCVALDAAPPECVSLLESAEVPALRSLDTARAHRLRAWFLFGTESNREIIAETAILFAVAPSPSVDIGVLG